MTGATKSGEKALTISSGQIVAVIEDPAFGAMQLARIPYFFPSMASVRVSPMMADLAVE